jgi:glycosyltransferase involved in cell wall biosynthesis
MIILQAVADGRLGGGTTHVLQLIDGTRDAFPGEIRLLSQHGSPILEEAERRGIRSYGLDFFKSRADLRLWLEIRRLLARVRPSLIHAHGARAALPLTHAGHAGPCLYSVHGYHFAAKGGLARHGGRISSRATTTVFVSPGDREIARRHAIRPRRAVVIPNGIEPEDVPEARPGDGRTLAFLGRLDEPKDPLLLVEILARLRNEGFRLRVIGDGPLRPAMVDRAATLGVSDRLDLLGTLPRPTALEALRDATVLLLPSRWEGLSLAVLEAMAMGVPVVASRVDGNEAVIEDGVSGFLVAERAPESYVRPVMELGADPVRRAHLVEAARRRIEGHFAWSTTCPRYVALYKDALGVE